MATIGFSTKFPWGEETHFVPKIWKGLTEYKIHDKLDIFLNGLEQYVIKNNLPDMDKIISKSLDDVFPKIHTIREDKADLWKPGRKIHPVVFNRTKDRFQFAPVLECKSVQKIEIRYIPEMPWLGCIKINGIFKSVFNSNFSDDKDFLNQLALNDGFNSIEDFFRFFNKNFTGKIIHFTNFEY
mgnify:CR=1 FL=1